MWDLHYNRVLFLVPTSYDDETILGLKRTIKELSVNQSYHYYVLQNYSRGVEDFRQQMTSVTSDVSNIKDSLKEAPQMLNIGKELDSLKSSLATYGATISDLKLSLAELKDSPTSSSGALLETFNVTLQGRLDSITEDLHHHHVLLHTLNCIMCVTAYFFFNVYFSIRRISLPHFKMQRNVFLLRFHRQIVLYKELTLFNRLW